MEERRRSPRRQVQGQSMAVPVAESVRVLDLSIAGVLLEDASPPDLGAIAKLKFSVGGEPLAADVEVKRVTAAPGWLPRRRQVRGDDADSPASH